ncbi:MAG: hypothetical protein ABSB19_01250 [Methylomonas sp.]
MHFFSKPHPSIEPDDSGHAPINMFQIWVGIFGAPVAWINQMLLSMPIAAHDCYPFQAPLTSPIRQDLPAILMTIGITCLAIALISGVSAWSTWRQYQHRQTDKGISLINRSEHRTRFLIKTSLMSSFIFIVAIVFNICAIMLVSPCSSWF